MYDLLSFWLHFYRALYQIVFSDLRRNPPATFNPRQDVVGSE